jgi:hypothetical protein
MSRNLNSGNAVLTGAKQTMASWSKVIESYEQVPDIYAGLFETRFANNQQFPYTLLTPSIMKPKGKTTEKLICDAFAAIHILERSGSQVVAKSYPYQDVCMIEMGNILLDSWLIISGVTSTGEADVSTIDFNTASARHFVTFLDKLRPSSPNADKTQLNAEKDKFNYLSPLNFKFMNYGRSSLIGGETVRQIILQPEIREPVWTILGDLFQKVISPAHLVILTDRELILIQDIPRGRKVQKVNYGGLWQYIRLSSIRSVAWTETEDGRLTLSIAVSPDRKIERLFAVSSKLEVEQLCAYYSHSAAVFAQRLLG